MSRRNRNQSQKNLKRESCKVRNVLIEVYPFYQALDKYEKRIFEKRVIKFISEKEFIAQRGFDLTFEKKVLIAASAIQLTFGLRRYLLKPFKHIILFQDAYYSPLTGYYHKGDVNLRGAIALSWNDFMKGVQAPHDKINLGLHEMAHALDLSSILLQNRYYYFKSLKEKFEQVAEDEYDKLKNHHPHFFREYGGTNPREFFSVAVEHFFEAPKEFNTHLPELYREMCLLLNQDPLHGIHRNLNVSHLKRHPNHFPKGDPPAPITQINGNFWSRPCLIPTLIALFSCVGISFVFGIPYYITTIVCLLTLTVGFIFSQYRIEVFTNYLALTHPLLRKRIINTDNLVYINFINHLVRRSMEVSFLDSCGIRHLSIPLSLSPRSIIKLQRALIQQKILVKIENHRIKKAGL